MYRQILWGPNDSWAWGLILGGRGEEGDLKWSMVLLRWACGTTRVCPASIQGACGLCLGLFELLLL